MSTSAEISGPNPGTKPPPKTHGWNHSEQVVVWYASNENQGAGFGIAYYHYSPPFESHPKWTDFSGHGHGREPTWWWSTPAVPREGMGVPDTALVPRSFPEVSWDCPACGQAHKTYAAPRETLVDAERRCIRDHIEEGCPAYPPRKK